MELSFRTDEDGTLIVGENIDSLLYEKVEVVGELDGNIIVSKTRKPYVMSKEEIKRWLENMAAIAKACKKLGVDLKDLG